MRAAAILTLILAIIVAVWAISDLKEIWADRYATFNQDLERAYHYDTLERQDGFLLILSAGMVIASIVMFSKSRKT